MFYKSAEEVLDGLDAYQKEAASQISGPLAIIAGAGTGKTRTIIHRIAFGILKNRWKPEEILAVTFTNKAATEMQERLEVLGITGTQVGTFHSIALKQLLKFWSKVVGTTPPRIDSQKEVHILDACERLGFNITKYQASKLADEIGWAKVSLISPTEYPAKAILNEREILETFGSINLAEELTLGEFVARIYQEYDSVKSERGLIDFEDVLLLMIHLISTNETLAKEIRQSIKRVIVDEFQDVSPLQYELLLCWLGEVNKELCVVGDPSQTIYSFTGATPQYLLSFKNNFKDSKSVELINDYRSTPPIVKLANSVLKKRTKESFPALKLISKVKENGIEVDFQKFSSDSKQVNEIAKQISGLIERGEAEASRIAILSRTNQQLDEIADALRRRKLKFFKKITNPQDETPDFRLPDDALTLASIHSAKGLEWDVVYLINLADGQLPLQRVKDEYSIEEEKRLLYVGITRAKHKLVLTYSEKKNETDRSIRFRSRFLDGIWPA